MTKKEAIRILGQYDVSMPIFYETEGDEIPSRDVTDALEMAIDALELTSMKAPEWEIDRIQTSGHVKFKCLCPTCAHRLNKEDDICPNCGQFIDWEGGEG